MRIAWFNPFAGIAGDMALGALVDAGADLDAVAETCRRLGYEGWSLAAAPVMRGGIAATRVTVTAAESRHHRRAGDIIDTIGRAGLPGRAADRATATFHLLAEAEGRLHGVAPADVHFHEIGAVDSIIDIVGTAIALDLLGIDEVAAAPVAVGVGTVDAAHGTLPNPAPAVLRVLEGAPVRGTDLAMELTTPTGAALLGALAVHWGGVPPMTVEASGYGAGTRNPPGRANVVQVLVGTATEPATAATADTALGAGPAAALGGTVETLVELATNLDDVTPETLGYLLPALLGAGAVDAWTTPATMKKSRPGIVLSALCPPDAAGAVTELIARETGTLGIRSRPAQRWAATRRTVTVEVDGRAVRVKQGPFGAKAEHDDVAAAAHESGRPLRDVARQAEAAAEAGAEVSGRDDNRDHNAR